MKHTKWKKWILTSSFYMLIVAFCSCSQQYKDEEIKKDLTSKVKNEKDFIGVRFVVSDGIVRLSGECPTVQARSKVESKVRSMYAVKAVLNNIAVAPVVIGTDQQLKQGVDSVLKTYPGVEAITRDSIVYLDGKVPDDQVIKLKNDLNTLKPKMVDARLTSR